MPITIANAGFELPALGGIDGAFSCGATPGWVTECSAENSGVWDPFPDTYPSGGYEGSQVAFTNGSTISQILTDTLAPSTLYTLSVLVGHRVGIAGEFTATVQLWAGATMIASGTADPDHGGWATAMASYSSGAVDPLAGLQLEIRLLGILATQVNYDDVQLDASEPQAVPEPGTLMLVGGVGLLLAYRRSRK